MAATVPWRTDERRLTRTEADGTEFPVAPWNRRGYEKTPVEEFRGRVTRELEMAVTERASLMQALAELRQRFITGQDAGQWLPGQAGEAHEVAVAIVSAAQVTADRYAAAARDQAARMTAAARERGDQMLAGAAGQARSMIADAEEQAAKVLSEAEARGREAATAALDVPVEQIPEDLRGEALRAARARAAYSGAFSSVYLANAIYVVDALQRMLLDWQVREAGTPPGRQHADQPGTAAAAEAG